MEVDTSVLHTYGGTTMLNVQKKFLLDDLFFLKSQNSENGARRWKVAEKMKMYHFIHFSRVKNIDFPQSDWQTKIYRVRSERQ